MIRRVNSGTTRLILSLGTSFLLLFCALESAASTATTKQQSLDEWRSLTAPASQPPKVFVKGDHVEFYFPHGDGVEVFNAHWSRLRVPTAGYRVNWALLRWNQKVSRIPDGRRGWREAAVIAGSEWRELAASLVSELT